MPRKTPETEEERTERLIRNNPWNGTGNWVDWSEMFWENYFMPSLEKIRQETIKGRVVA